MVIDTTGKIWNAKIDSSGRVLLPAELRQSLGVKEGDQLLLIKDSKGLHLKSFEESLAEIQDYFRSLAPASELWSEEIMAERRREAAHE